MHSLLHYNTFGLPASCRELLEYDSTAALQALLPRLRKEKWFHIGGGSNLVFTHDYPGLILHSKIQTLEEVGRDADFILIKAGAGFVWDDFVADCVDRGLYGLENLSLIPGEIGASAVQNIGAYGVEACQLIKEVHAVEVATGEARAIPVDDCHYAYRNSIFKHEWAGRFIITHVTYRLQRRFQPDLTYGAIRRELEARSMVPEVLTAKALRNMIIEIRRAKLPDPKEIGSVGSFFMNPIVSHERFEALLKEHPAMPHYPIEGGVKIPAGWMIEQCNWKGRNLGHAGVYEKQALVLVNRGGATGEEIVRLSQAIQADVLRKFGVEIHPEAIFVE